MASPFLSEIRIMSFGFAPKGWALCNGQLLAINQNQALFSLIGTTYGGNGQTNFGLPNLQGRVPMHIGNGHAQGEIGGEVNHTLLQPEMAAHTHFLVVKNATADTGQGAPGEVAGPTKALGEAIATQAPAAPAPVSLYGTGSPTTTFASIAIANSGGGLAHPNQQPYLTLSFCIALAGAFPSQN